MADCRQDNDDDYDDDADDGGGERHTAAAAAAAAATGHSASGRVEGPRSDRLVYGRGAVRTRGFAHSGGARFRPPAARAIPDKHVLVRIAGRV